MSLAIFKSNDGIELVIDSRDGECYYPGFKSLARICSINLEKEIQPAQTKRVIEDTPRVVTDLSTFYAQVLTPGGLQGIILIPKELGSKAIKKYNQALYEEMAEAGDLIFLHQLAGFTL